MHAYQFDFYILPHTLCLAHSPSVVPGGTITASWLHVSWLIAHELIHLLVLRRIKAMHSLEDLQQGIGLGLGLGSDSSLGVGSGLGSSHG